LINPPLVSVVIPCYNAAAWLRETLDSALRQTGVNLQVILIDDGSTDGSAEIAAREFPQVELSRTEHRGASRARDCGLRAARGEYIQFLDADDLLLEGKIARQCAHLISTGADIVYSDWRYLVETDEGMFQPSTLCTQQMRGAPELELFMDFWAPNSAYLFRRRMVEAVGGFNETLPILQDARFVLDCALNGARFTYLPGEVSRYRRHAAQISGNRVAFVRDMLTNAVQVQAWWVTHGGITVERHAALVAVYGNVARMSYEVDRATFWEAYRAVLQLEPHYVPAHPRGLAFLTRVVGYPRAEALAREYRSLKRAVRKLVGEPSPEHLRAMN